MITRIHTESFKRFDRQSFDLGPISLLAGPNNSGKSTLLQAVMVWNLALQKWCEKKGPDSGSRAKDRPGAPITRQEFSADFFALKCIRENLAAVLLLDGDNRNLPNRELSGCSN